MADGQQALMISLPLNKDVNVTTDGAGEATVTVNANQRGLDSETNDVNLLAA